MNTTDILVLIDRASFKDHQSALVTVLIDKLIAEGVLVEYYYFDGDPRRCYAHQKFQKSKFSAQRGGMPF